MRTRLCQGFRSRNNIVSLIEDCGCIVKSFHLDTARKICAKKLDSMHAAVVHADVHLGLVELIEYIF